MRTDLRGLQHWMQRSIVTGEGFRSASRMILPSVTLDSGERLAIYRRIYEARLVDALRADYPGLSAWLGDAVFAELAGLYLGAHPSRSYTLNRLGDHLPEFISQVDGLRRGTLVKDLARLELLETEVFDEQEAIPGEFPSFAGMSEAELAQVRFVTIPALRMASFRYPVHRLLTALRAGQAAPRMAPRPTWLAVYRREYQVHHLVLRPEAADLLGALAAGKPLGEAIARCPALGPAAVFRQFQTWRAAGLLRGIELPA
jgi:hypothetical protein